MSAGRTFLIPAVSGIFEELSVSAAIRVGAHPRVWDGVGWHPLHNAPSVSEIELQHGRQLERVKYNVRNMERARLERTLVVGKHAGLIDLFVPILVGAEVPAVLVTGPIATERPTSADLSKRWRWLTARQGDPVDPEFAHFVERTLATLLLESEKLKSFRRFLSCLVKLMANPEAPESILEELEKLRAELWQARKFERSWEAARAMVDERTVASWHTRYREGELGRLGLPRAPDQALVALFVPKSDEPDAVDELLRRDALQRACVEMAHRAGFAISGRVGDYGVFFLSAARGTRQQKRQRLLDLAEQIGPIAKRRYGLRLHFGRSGLPTAAPLSEHYQAALRSAEVALARRESMLEVPPDSRAATLPLHELRRKLGESALERPSELALGFERYLEAVALQAGHRAEVARGYLAAGVEQIAAVLLDAGLLDEKTFADESSELVRSTLGAHTLPDLLSAHRRVVAVMSEAAQHPASAQRDRSLRRALGFIHRHYAEPLRQSTVSRIAGFAPDHFARLFKHTQGTTFEKYLRRLRIERAKELLANTDLELARVAELAGFGTRQYLGRIFKADVRLTPLAYRRRQGPDGPRRPVGK